MTKTTRMRRYALIDENGNIRYNGVWVDGLYLIHIHGVKWGGHIGEDEMKQLLDARQDIGEPLKLVFMDSEDCEWKPEQKQNG